MKKLILFLLLFALPATALAHRPVAHWDLVPFQIVDSTMKIGVVAFHVDGVQVEFRVNSTLVSTVTDPTYNDRTDVWEFWFNFDASGYSDGAVTIDAKAVPQNATDPSYDLASITLYANSGGTLTNSTVTYADSVNGLDTNSGTEASPYQTLATAVSNTSAGGTVYLKAGTYSADSLGGGSRDYWTTISAAPNVDPSDVIITAGRPSTQRLRWTNLKLVSTSTSGAYTPILTGNGTTYVHYVWLDDIEICNINGRYAASTNVFNNGYIAYVTDCHIHDITNGPGGRLLRGIEMDTITSDSWSGGGRLVVNCSVDDIDPGTTGAHPDFHQSYPGSNDWVTDAILYNVSGFDCNSQGLFGLDLKDSAFINVLFERRPGVPYTSQYSGDMQNVIFAHVDIIGQTFRWRGVDPSGYNADGVYMLNCLQGNMSIMEDGDPSGVVFDYNHFIGGTPFGTNYTTGDLNFVDADNSDYHLDLTSPAFGTGMNLQCVPADIDGEPYNVNGRNKGCYAMAEIVANAGEDQSVLDRENDGSEYVILDAGDTTNLNDDTLSYSWSEGGTTIATDSPCRANLTVGSHTITLTVTDSSSNTYTDTVDITVTAPTGTLQRLNLAGTSTPRFTRPMDLVWPGTVGDMDVCLWEDDKFAAVSITIDDNIAPDHEWWVARGNEYGWRFTWFIIINSLYENSGNDYFGSWPEFNTLYSYGHDVQSHTISHNSSDDTRPENEVIIEYRDSLAMIEENIPGNIADSIGWPYGNSNSDIARLFVTCGRGVYGVPNKPESVNYISTGSASGRIDAAYLDSVLYGTSSISWLNTTAYMRGWLSAHFHYVPDKTALAADMAYMAAREDLVWVGKFRDVAHYGQERDTCTISNVSINPTQISFDISDEMDDTIFVYPLTIKIRVDNSWTSVDAIQDGQTIEATLMTHTDGNSYVLVKAVPDKGTVVLAPSGLSNIAPVADAGSDQQVTDANSDGYETVALDGTGSSDLDGTIVDYEWSEGGTQIATGSQPSVSLAVGTHTITLTVTDDDSSVGTDTVTVTVSEPVGGRTFSISGHTNDRCIYSDGTGTWYGDGEIRAGGATTLDGAAILVFELPALNAGELIGAAYLDVYLNGLSNYPHGNLDLYGLGYRAASNVVGTDFYQGTYDGDTTDAWAIQSGIADGNSTAGWLYSSTAAVSDFVGFLTDQYTAGAVGGEYVFLRLNAEEDQGNYYYWKIASASSSNVPLLTIETNYSPSADAGSDQSVTDDDDDGYATVTLDGSGSADAGDTLSYAWSESGSQIATGSTPDVALAVGTHTVTLTVTDSYGATDTDTVEVTVEQYVNVAPDANAGVNQDVTDSDSDGYVTVTLDGTSSNDTDGSIVSYVWVENGTQIATGSTASVSLAVGAYTVALTVTDDDGATDVDTVRILVYPADDGSGRVIYVSGHTQDKCIYSNGSSPWYGDKEIRAGGATTVDGAAVLVFQLPVLAENEVVTGGAVYVYLNGLSNYPHGNLDLYGIGYRAAYTVLAEDFYQGTYDGDTTDAWALQSGLADGNSTAGWMISNSSASAEVATFLNDQYLAGAVGGEYVFTRLNAEEDQGNYYYWKIASASSLYVPLLKIETVYVNAAPEADAGSDQSVTDSTGSGSVAVTLDGTASSDSDGTIASYVWSEGGVQIATGSSPSVTLGVGVHTIDLTVTDDDGDSDTDSVEVVVYGRTLTGAYSWPVNVLPTQSGVFTVEFDLTANLDYVDCVTGLAGGEPDWWSDLACIVRLNDSGYVDVRDGSGYSYDVAVAYIANDSFHVEMIVDVPNVTYSVYVTPDGGSRTLLAEDYAFRTEQASITSIDHWTLNDTNDESGQTVSNLTITD